jgi:threonine/homoserine/homoserine lactone efflux protein
MLGAIIFGFLVGFILAIAPGPVGVTIFKKSIEKGSNYGAKIAIGNGIIDFIFCLFAMFASSALILLLSDFVDAYPVPVFIVQVTIIVSLIVYGLFHLKPQKDTTEINLDEVKERGKIFRLLSSKGPLFIGMAVALTNLANPSYFASLLFITMNVHKVNFIENSAVNNLFFSFGFGIGNTIWLYLLVKIVMYFKNRLSPKTLLKINKFAGLTYIGFGTLLGYRLFSVTKWSEILRFAFSAF